MQLLLTTATILAFGLAGQQDAGTNNFQGKLFRVNPQRNTLSVIAGNFEKSGGQGDNQNPDPTAKRYIVRVTDKTSIHWNKGSTKPITMDELERLSLRQIVIPMTVYYNKDDRNTGEQPVTATEIVLQRTNN